MVTIASIQLFLSIWITKKANAKFKREEMDKKLDKEDFQKYESDHKEVHDRDRKDVLYIRSRVDDIAKHLLGGK
jgi:hypothetical protein